MASPVVSEKLGNWYRVDDLVYRSIYGNIIEYQEDVDVTRIRAQLD